MVQLKVVQDQRQQKKDLTYTIYYRLTDYKKSIYLTSGFSVLKEHWDKQACKVVKNHPNAAIINASLSKRYFEIQKIVIKLEEEDRFTFTHLKEILGGEPRKSVLTVKEFTDGLIANMLKQRKIGNAGVYQSALNALSHFKPANKLQFIDITIDFLDNYHTYLITKDVKVNTITFYHSSPQWKQPQENTFLRLFPFLPTLFTHIQSIKQHFKSTMRLSSKSNFRTKSI